MKILRSGLISFAAGVITLLILCVIKLGDISTYIPVLVTLITFQLLEIKGKDKKKESN